MKPKLKKGQFVIFHATEEWEYLKNRKVFTVREYPEDSRDTIVPFGKKAEILEYFSKRNAFLEGWLVYFIDGSGTTFLSMDNYEKGACSLVVSDYNKFWLKFNETN